MQNDGKPDELLGVRVGTWNVGSEKEDVLNPARWIVGVGEIAGRVR